MKWPRAMKQSPHNHSISHEIGPSPKLLAMTEKGQKLKTSTTIFKNMLDFYTPDGYLYRQGVF
jgi:hypothetical protein